jgi:hypothetical protein
MSHDTGGEGLPPTGGLLEVVADFEGPFALMACDAPLLFDQPVAARPGVYLWTVPTSTGYRPWYVGKTSRSFAHRTAEHVSGYLSGQYKAYSLASIVDGSYVPVPGGPTKRFPDSVPELLSSIRDRLPAILEVLAVTRLFVAPLDAPVLDRVEGALGRHYEAQFGGYLEPGHRLPAAAADARPLLLRTGAAAVVLGLPTEIREP